VQDISLWRLYLLRACYLLLAVGLVIFMWPRVLIASELRHMDGVATTMFAALPVLALLGLRYPLQMLPILFFDMIWKVIWLSSVALPRWQSDTMTPAIAGTVFDCSVAVILLAAVPWDYVAHNYLLKPGERWWPRHGTSQTHPAA
jgi:hypothetical protein